MCDDAWAGGMAVSAYFVGFLFGAGMGGSMADAYGRRPVFVMSSVVLTVSAVAGAFAPNYIIFLLSRVLIGVSIGGHSCGGYVLVMEFIGSSKRGLVGGIIWTIW